LVTPMRQPSGQASLMLVQIFVGVLAVVLARELQFGGARCRHGGRSGWDGDATLARPGSSPCEKNVKKTSNNAIRQAHPETAALRLARRYTDVPALVCADSLDQRQPQTQPLATPLGAAHERLEHALLLVQRNAHAAVFDP